MKYMKTVAGQMISGFAIKLVGTVKERNQK